MIINFRFGKNSYLPKEQPLLLTGVRFYFENS